MQLVAMAAVVRERVPQLGRAPASRLVALSLSPVVLSCAESRKQPVARLLSQGAPHDLPVKKSCYVTLCNEWTLSKQLPGERYAKPLPCRSWSCDLCAPKRVKQLVAQAIAGDPRRFLTLTVSPEAGETPLDRHAALMRAWHLFVKRVRRLPGFGSFQYLWVVEATKAGEPHLHVLLRCGWIDQKLISEWFDELARSPIVDIRSISGVKHVAQYVAKYIVKNLARFENSKRYFASREYELDQLDDQEPEPSRGPGWTVIREHIARVTSSWIAEGWAGRNDGGDRLKFLPGSWWSP